jgi:NTE family protein
MFAAWEIGVWKALRHRFQPDLIAGASAGAWTGWCISGGASAEELEAQWLDPALGRILTAYRLHRTGFLKPDFLYGKAHELFGQFTPKIPFGLTLTEVPAFRRRLARDGEIRWEHLAASASIPFVFPPVRIDGRRYVDGGFLGALPLWAAESMGATRVVALNCLNRFPFRAVHRFTAALGPKLSKGLAVDLIEPSEPLGSLIDSVRWSRDVIRRAIDLGEKDGSQAMSSITM